MYSVIVRNIFFKSKIRFHAYTNMNKVYEKIIPSSCKFHQAIGDK